MSTESTDHYLSAVGNVPDGATTPDTTTPDVDATPASRGGHTELPPIFAAWLKDRREFAATAWSALHRTGHRAAWHGVRSPWYVARLVFMSPRGAGRIWLALFGWLLDSELRPLRLEAVVGSDPSMALKLRKERNDRIHRRLIVTGTLAGLAVLTGLVLRALGMLPPAWVMWAALAGSILGLGYIGRPVGKKLVRPATVPVNNPGPPTAPYVMRALVNLRIGGMAKVEDIALLFDVARVGPGHQVDLELPAGVPASAIIEKRSELSAALRRELGTVWPSVGKRHEGHLVLYVCDEPMNKAKQAKWPLLRDGAVNLFRPVPMFTDQRGRWVDLVLAYTSGVIGAVPRMGKTFALRELLLIAGLDPRAKVCAIDLKGTGDFSPTALFAHFYSVGDEDEDVEKQLTAMRELREEMRRRARVIRSLPHEECPDNKVTDVLANRRDLNLGPVVVGVDECQVWFQHDDKEVREEFIKLCADLVKRGPALGIICYFATQKPSAKSIPTDIADNASVRLCFKVNGQVANDQVLGTSSYQAGLRATQFAFEDKGIAYLRSDGADAQIVRSVAGLDAPASEKVALRARHARQTAGLLTGQAAGEVMEAEAEQVALLDDVRQVVASGAVMHLTDLVAGLAALRPALYGSLDVRGLGSQLRGAGVQVANVHDASKPRERSTAKGVRREWLDVAATEVIGDGEDDAGASRLRLVP